jgi:hypothetical protein
MRRKIMTILIVFVMIFSVAAPSTLNPSGATTISSAKEKIIKCKYTSKLKKKYDKIKMNYKLSKVNKIMGHKYTKIVKTTKIGDTCILTIYRWSFIDEKKRIVVSVDVTFENGKSTFVKTYKETTI